MKVSNPTYKPIKLRQFPLKEGTPINLYGYVCNGAGAVGILCQNACDEDGTLVVAGEVCKAEVEKTYGESLTTNAMRSMNGIRFYGNDGTPVVDPEYDPYILPEASASAIGGVKMAANQAASTASDVAGLVTDFNALLTKLKASGVMAADEE